MKDACVWLVALLMLTFVTRYTYQIWKREISPRLSTWVIFLAGTGLSFVTYLIAEKHDIRSGILNTMDFVATAIVFLAIITWRKQKTYFKSFEKWYLGGVCAVVVYGILSGDAWGSNLFTQVLISAGYVPTIQNMVVEKRNDESFTGWGGSLAAGLIGLYPAIVGGNSLSILYALRAVVSVSITILIMTYYELHSRRSGRTN